MTARSIFHRPFSVAALSVLALVSISCGGDDEPDATTPRPAATDAPSADAPADETGSGDVATDGSTAEAPAATDAPTSPGPDGPAAGAGTGFIQIGDLRHDLVVQDCVTLFGAIAGRAVSASEPENVDVSFDFSPEDWQERSASEGWTTAGSVRLDVEEPYQQWESGEDAVGLFNLPPEIDPSTIVLSGVDVSDDGTSVRGEAVFIDLVSVLTSSPVAPTNGTYEFSCPA